MFKECEIFGRPDGEPIYCSDAGNCKLSDFDCKIMDKEKLAIILDAALNWGYMV